MSWDSYRDTLIQSGSAELAAVCGVEGGVWATSQNLNITADEIKTLVSGFSNPANFQEKGVIVGGTKYMYIQSDNGQIQAKKGAGGISIAKGAKCLIIAVYGNGQQPGACRAQVERIRDYLRDQGY